MDDNKNLILGSIAIIAVVLVALILFMPKDKNNETKTDIDNVKVYIHHEKTKEKEGYYSECKLSTEDLIKVRNEFDKLSHMSMDNILVDSKINGDYKVVVEDNYIAFDKKHNNSVYISGFDAMFSFKSELYDIVINRCGTIDS